MNTNTTAVETAPPAPQHSSLLSAHGLLGPGVWVMRHFRLMGQAMVMVVAAVLPLVVMSALNISNLLRRDDLHERQLAGVEYIHAVTDLLRAVAPQGHADGASAAVGQALSAFERVDAAVPPATRPQARVDAVHTAVRDLASAQRRGDRTAQLRQRNASFEHGLALIGQAAHHADLMQGFDDGVARLVVATTMDAPRLLAALASTGWAADLAGEGGAPAARALRDALAELRVQTRNLRATLSVVTSEAVESAVVPGQSAPAPDSGTQHAFDPLLATADALVVELDSFAPTQQGRSAARVRALADDAITAYAAASRRSAGQLRASIDREATSTRALQRTVVAATVASGLIAVYFAFAFFRVAGGGMRTLGASIARLAAGDLSARSRIWGRDEVGDSLRRLNVSLANLGSLVVKVRGSADDVAVTASYIASSSHEIAEVSSRSTSMLDQMIQRTAMLRDGIETNRGTVSGVATTLAATRDVAESSGRLVDTVVARMAGLTVKSRQIREIAAIINGIAFKTNILAINAAIEAARAGSSGRGFAVVADEVRKLAIQCAKSGRQIGEIVQDSTREIEGGNADVRKAGTAVGDMVGTIRALSDTMREAANWTERHGEEILRLDEDLNRLRTVEGSNGHFAIQIGDSANRLETQSQGLRELLDEFGAAHHLA